MWSTWSFSLNGLCLWCVLLQVPQLAEGIGCFKCTSVKGSEPRCEDPFNNTSPQLFYHDTCQAPREGHEGMFAARRCIKMKGWNETYSVVVRDCDVPGKTPFRDLFDMIDCWMSSIIWQGTLMKGCLLLCYDDGCNSATQLWLKQRILRNVDELRTQMKDRC